MAQLLHFPTEEDLHTIKCSIQSFLVQQTGHQRDTMLLALRNILDKYKLSKIQLSDFSVHRTITPGLSYIQGKVEACDGHCPGCGSDLYHLTSPVRILSIQEGKLDKVTYGCSCGSIFYRLEKK